MTSTIFNRAQPLQTMANLPPRLWVLGPWRDFCLLHGFGGLISLIVVAAALVNPNSWVLLVTVYSAILGFPHLAATHLRLGLDPDCKSQAMKLVVIAPAVIVSILAVLIYAAHILSYVVFAWFIAQTWHANRQNFGIMRRYIRMYGSIPEHWVNRLAGAVVQYAPWAFVIGALSMKTETYLGYPITIVGSRWLLPLAVILWVISLGAILSYLVLEIREWVLKKAVPGRLLCVLSGTLVNLMAWGFLAELSWGYLTVSLWHALQYISYAHAFRSSPPPNLMPKRLSLVKHLGFVLLIGLAIKACFGGLQLILPAVFVVCHIGINAHHYLADTLIWRRVRPATSSPG